MSKKRRTSTLETDLNLKRYMGPMEVPAGVFKDINEYKKVFIRIARALSIGKLRTPHNMGSHLFNGIKIEFKKDIKYESIYLDHINAKIILQAPIKPKETEENKRKRILFYHTELMKSVEQMKVHGIIAIYLSISTRGRKKLSR